MKIRIITIGKLKNDWLLSGCQEYLKRLKSKVSLELIEVKDEEQIKKNLLPRYITWILDEHGVELSSVELAQKFRNYHVQSQAGITFVIGAADGFSKFFLDQGHFLFSLSKLTLPHQMVRVILLEQIYRAFSIIDGEPYHRE